MSEKPKRRIPPDLFPEIMARAGQGFTGRQIAEWLEAEHNVSVTRQSVNRFLRGRAKERTEITTAVVREKLAPLVTKDLEALAGVRTRLHDYEMKAAEAEQIDVAIRAAEAQRKVIETSLRFSGADTPDSSAVLGVVMLPPEDADSGEGDDD